MSRRFHTYGDLVDLDGMEPLTHTLDEQGRPADPSQCASANCPRCGAPVVTGRLHMAPDHPASALQRWCLDWPDLRHALDIAISARQQHEPNFYAYEAENVLREFDYLLRTVTDLAESLTPEAEAGCTMSNRAQFSRS